MSKYVLNEKGVALLCDPLQDNQIPKKKRKKRKVGRVFLIAALVIAALFAAVAVINFVHRKNMEKYIDRYGKVLYENQLMPEKDERGNYCFTTDGDFKVMQLTDLHLGGGVLFADGDKRAIHAVAAMVEAEKPDLVIVTGDISFAVPWSGTLNNKIAHEYLKRLMENLGVYWTVTFGNHDAEKYNFYNRAAVARMYEDETMKYCLFSAGPADVYGESNHVITVKNSLGLLTSAFVMIDSNAYTEEDVFGLGWDYDNVHEDQIAWYEENIRYYTQKNLEAYNALEESARPVGFDTSAIHSYMYMHIPPEEMLTAYNEAVAKGDAYDCEAYGIAGDDGQVVFPSAYPDELFETVVELGSTKGIFFGHDHRNSLRFTREGVLLAYGFSIDYSAYAGDTGYQRGCTLLTLSENAASLRYSNYYSDIYDHLDDKVDMTLPAWYN